MTKHDVKTVEKRKRLMKTGLKVVFVIAWLPILWLLLAATLGKVLSAFIGIAWVVQSLVLFCSLLLIFFAFRYLSLLTEKIFGN